MKVLLILALLAAASYGSTVLETFDAPDTGITGLAWGDGVLWAVDGTTQYVYGIDPSDGSVTSSFYITDQTPSYDPFPGGLPGATAQSMWPCTAARSTARCTSMTTPETIRDSSTYTVEAAP